MIFKAGALGLNALADSGATDSFGKTEVCPTRFTQIHLQLVFAVENRVSLIQRSWKDELYKYITGIIQNNQHKLLAINGIPDHIHILIGMRPTQALSLLMQQIKRDSCSWINERRFAKGKFQWQEGYGAFSYSRSDLSNVIQYIEDQELHHRKRSFIQEYKELLNEFGVLYDDKYIFKEII